MQKRHKLLFHIGMPKTGTTSIQEFLWLNREKLSSHGWVYPELFSFSEAGRDHKNGTHLTFTLMGLLGCPASYIRYGYGYDRKILTEVFTRDVATPILDALQSKDVIISEEDIWRHLGINISHLLSFFKGHGCDVRVIVYLRRQDKYLESLYDTLTKFSNSHWQSMMDFYYSSTEAARDFVGRYDMGMSDRDVAECICGVSFRYMDILSAISGVIGDDALIVRPFERESLKDGDVISDFLASLGLDPSAPDWKRPPRMNQKFGRANIFEIKKIFEEVNSILLKNPGGHSAAAYMTAFTELDEELREEYGDQVSVMPVATRRKLLKKYESENAEIARRYLGRERLFLDMKTDIPCYESQPTDFEKDIVRVFSRLIFKVGQKEYEHRETLLKKLRFLGNIRHSGKKLACFGGGEIAALVAGAYDDVSLVVTHLQGDTTDYGVPVKPTKDVKDPKSLLFIVTLPSSQYPFIVKQLTKAGLKEYEDFLPWWEFIS